MEKMYCRNDYSNAKVYPDLKEISKNFLYPNPNRMNVVLENVNVQILEGEFVTILGKSGCGKTTLLNIIAGFENLFGGEILLDDQSIRNISSDRVMVFQESAFFPWLQPFKTRSCLENRKNSKGSKTTNCKTLLEYC